MINTFIILSTIIFSGLFTIWKLSDYFNVMLKMGFLAMLFFGGYIIYTQHLFG